jgi:hypothetical protein
VVARVSDRPIDESPDDQRVAVSVLDPAQGTRDLWLYDVKRGLRTRFEESASAAITLVVNWTAGLRK